VRELRNVLERAALMTDGDSIGVDQTVRALALHGTTRSAAPPAASASPAPLARADDAAAAPGKSMLRDAERAAILAAVQRHKGSRAELARQLGISERSLYRKLRDIKG
jgi:DNA-binding NtrC family response regulator